MSSEFLGTIRIPVVSFRPTKVDVTSPLLSIYGDDITRNFKSTMELPSITPGSTRFKLEVVSTRGDVVATFSALVKELVTYDYDVSEGKVHLVFSYTTPTDPRYVGEVPILEPVVTRITAHSGFMAVMMEGDRSACVSKFANDYTIVSHGNVLYYRYYMSEIKVNTNIKSSIYPKDITLGVIGYFYSDPIEPPKEESDRFIQYTEKLFMKVFPDPTSYYI